MEFKAKRRKLKITVDEKVFEVRFPKLGELNQYKEKIKDPSADIPKELELFLSELGLPAEAQLSLEIGDLGEIVGLLTDQKKTP